MYFRYLQLHHATRAQFPTPPRLTMDPIEELLAQEQLQKPLSALYLDLLRIDSTKVDRLWDQRKTDIPDLDREDLDDCMADSTALLISSKEGLIQVKFLHRVYYTPRGSTRYTHNDRRIVPRCQNSVGTYFHMFWSCPKIARYWAEVVDSVNGRLQLNLPVSPELALLGIQDDDQRPRYTKLLLTYLFYYAKREIVLHWNAPSSPTVGSWEKSINAVLPLYKLTYLNRNCPKKCNTIWQPWTA